MGEEADLAERELDLLHDQAVLGDVEAQRVLVELWSLRARKVASSVKRGDLEADDVGGIALLALWETIIATRPPEVGFSDQATWSIRSAIRTARARAELGEEITESTARRRRRDFAAILDAEAAGAKTSKAIATATGLSPRRIAAARDAAALARPLPLTDANNLAQPRQVSYKADEQIRAAARMAAEVSSDVAGGTGTARNSILEEWVVALHEGDSQGAATATAAARAEVSERTARRHISAGRPAFARALAAVLDEG